MIGKEIERALAYQNVELGNSIIKADKVTVRGGKVISIENGRGVIGEVEFTFSAHTNYNGADNTPDFRLAINAPFDVDAFDTVKSFISLVEAEV